MYITTSRRSGDSFNSLRRLNQVLDQAFGVMPFPQGEGGAITSSWIPATDVFEDRDAVKIVAEIPGVRPEDLKISLENNMLTIRGEKKQATEENTERVHRYERSYGAFERSFALPATVDVERIEARFEDGLLTVTLPKAERARPREIAVKTNANATQNAIGS